MKIYLDGSHLLKSMCSDESRVLDICRNSTLHLPIEALWRC
ncbi:mCG1035695 [Mus musculus]|nr:mCG1035695 [Mus musculus]